MPKVSIIASDLCSAVTIRAYLLALALLEIGYNVEVVGFQFGPTLYAEPPERVVVRSVSGGILPGILLKVPELLELLDGDYIYAIKPPQLCQPTVIYLTDKAKNFNYLKNKLFQNFLMQLDQK